MNIHAMESEAPNATRRAEYCIFLIGFLYALEACLVNFELL